VKFPVNTRVRLPPLSFSLSVVVLPDFSFPSIRTDVFSKKIIAPYFFLSYSKLPFFFSARVSLSPPSWEKDAGPCCFFPPMVEADAFSPVRDHPTPPLPPSRS